MTWLRSPSEDPDVYLRGKVLYDEEAWNTVRVRLLGCRGEGMIHDAAQATVPLKAGEDVILRGPFWVPVGEGVS